MVDQVDDLERRVPVCTWIGDHIDAVNTQLNASLQACHDCFHLEERPAVQIFAAPLAQAFGLDAFCNFQTYPISLVIDVGRMLPQDWLLAVAHEYAHAQAGFPGHHQQFARSLAHLCLGLEIAPPASVPDQEDRLRSYPAYASTLDPLAFWLGRVASFR